MKSSIQSYSRSAQGRDSVRPLKNLYLRANRTILSGTLALASVAFFSCSNGGTKAGADSTAPAKIVVQDTIVQHFPHGGGQHVPMSDIQPCLDAYVKIMGEYGITADSPAVPITKCPPKTYPITLTEGLTYVTFRAYLDSVVNAIDSVGHGANVWLKIQPGITTQQFTSTYGLPNSRTGRITFFIVPALIDSTKASQPMSPGGSGGYEIGGLQP